MAMLAQLESRLTSERVLRQHEHRREQGIIWGVDKGFKGELDLGTRKLIKKLAAEDFSLREIAKTLTAEGHKTPKGGLWYPQTVKAILDSPQTKQLKKVA
jgi:DNA invertase Pin-like site-specific DNA recombinase